VDIRTKDFELNLPSLAIEIPYETSVGQRAPHNPASSPIRLQAGRAPVIFGVRQKEKNQLTYVWS
jgi:hypothetical protein